MAPLSRFGASKFRNATPYIPARDEWYRNNLPPTASSAPLSALTTFTSEIKTTREWIFTLSSSGDLSYRRYDTTGTGDQMGSDKVGSGSIADWDVSGLEGGQLAVGGVDGSVYIYRLPSASPSKLQHVHTIPGSSPITHVTLNPTAPSILLVSTVSTPAAIYDLGLPDSPAITLNAKEPKGLWSIAWSPDGKKVAAIGRSGTGYIWDPRSSSDPFTTRTLPLQPLKPARAVFVGDDLFVTSFSRTRNREYHLFSGTNLSTIFTNSLDTSPGLLLPVVDNERKIVYLGAKGDMSIRQVELSGPQGYQETLHPLPSPLSSASLALAHPTTLPVMSAQIATLLIPLVDKDGDVVLPLGVRVPRRQLIDFHEDLYPEIQGTIPEQTGGEWLKGSDSSPLLISLDPSRRGIWEKRLAEYSPERSEDGAQATTVPSEATPARHSEVLEEAKPVVAVSDTSQSLPADSPVSKSAPQVTAVQQTSTTSQAQTNTAVTQSGSRPSLEGSETYSSVKYKAKIMGRHIAQQLERHRGEKKQGPLMVGLQGPQGCGKTTLCNALLSYLQESPRNLKIAVLSLDDLYKTNQGLKDVAAQHPDNKLLAGRGPPGTDDPELATRVLSAVQSIREGSTVELPIFDKSLCGGEGDRSGDTVKVIGPLDVFILEGWSMGFGALSEQELKARYDSKRTLSDTSYFLSHPLSALVTLNSYLSEFAAQVYAPFSTIVQIEPESYKYVFDWRSEQERGMKAANGGKGMTDEQVQAFVERYMPGYELWKDGIWDEKQSWAGRGLRLWYGKEREIVKVDTPEPEKSSRIGDAKDIQDDVKEDVVPSQPTESRLEPALQVEAKEPTTRQAAVRESPSATKESTKRSPLPTTSNTVSSDTAKPSPSATTPGKRYNPNWSRKFLAAKSPLIPTYDQIPALSTLHQDSQVLRATRNLVFFPIQGPGGRIGVHPLAKKGRMVNGGEGYLSGGVEVTDFAVEPFTLDGRTLVALAGEDGLVRIWAVGNEGVKGPGPEPQIVVKGQGIDKIAQVVFHPTARDLLVLATNDAGKANVRLFDLSTTKEELVVPLEATGVFNISWSTDGSRLAAATKDGRVIVLDPRDPSSAISGKAHDSSRSFQLVWIDDAHLISVGFSRGSQRRINLYKIGSTNIETIHSLLIDVSPSVLFPVYDPDTSILYVWGKGERQIQAYEVHPDNANEPIAKIPSYTSGSPQLGLAFFPKTALDVKKVEVAKALRLTAKTIEEVTFTIPRNKPDFFQDDIYVESDDVETSSTSAQKWLKGQDAPLRKISLKPNAMTSLSEAPQTTSAAKAKFVPAKDVLSEAEKKKREMDRLFQKAKMDESSDEDDEPKRSGLPPPDDDW